MREKDSLDKFHNSKISTRTKTRIKKRKSVKSLVGKKKNNSWKDSLSLAFFDQATKGILRDNNSRNIPIIYAQNGIIYKETAAGKTKLGKIKHIKRKVTIDKYTIE